MEVSLERKIPMAARHPVRQLLLPALATVIASCAGGGSGPDGGETCNSDPDCDDGFECTIDTCGADNLCRHVGIDERCGDGQVCESGRGCVTSASCDTDEECDDAIACTVDSCGAGNICNHITVNERCGAGETCDRSMGCVGPTGCTSDAECDDAIACTRDVCTAGGTCSHNALNELCNTAAGERCHQTRGCYAPMPCDTADDCDDGNFCNGAEICTPEFGCEPAPEPRVCDDSEDCTVDTCDSTLDMCVFACDPTRGAACLAMCPPPAAGCNGRFRLTGTTSFGCGSCTSVDFSEATFENADGILSVRARNYNTTPPLPGGLVLSDSEAPVCPDFDATVTIGGGCEEVYRIRGMFTDDDNITGTLEWNFIDRDGFSCLFCGCSGGSSSVTGMRIP